MKKSNSTSFQKTLTFAATVATLGASLGVPSLALGMQLIETPATEKGAQASGPSAGVVQQKWKKRTDAGATQMKERNIKQGKLNNGIGANQLKLDGRTGTSQGKLNKAKSLGPANTNNLSGEQLPAVQLPAVQK